ncbi:hypothetical protein TWF281_006947 [Arthrobotrys megalospora]
MSASQIVILDYVVYKLTYDGDIFWKRVSGQARPDLEEIVQYISTGHKSESEIREEAAKIEQNDLPEMIEIARDAGNTHHANELQEILDGVTKDGGSTNKLAIQLATNLSKVPEDWAEFHPDGHKSVKLWVDSGRLYRLRFARNHSIVESFSGSWRQEISAVGSCDIIGRGKFWLKVDKVTNEVEWHREHDPKNVWQFGISRPEFSSDGITLEDAKKHLIKSSGPQVYHVTEEQGIVKYDVSGHNPNGEYFAAFASGDCDWAKGWAVHDNVVYWIRKDQLVCTSQEVNKAHKPELVAPWNIYDGAAECFVVAINGIIFVYNQVRNVIEWTKAIPGDAKNWGTDKPIWKELAVEWDGENANELVISAGAADNAHFLGVRNGDDIKLLSIHGACH